MSADQLNRMKEGFFGKLEGVVAEAKRLRVRGFDDQGPEEATKQLLLEPLLKPWASPPPPTTYASSKSWATRWITC